MVIGGLKIHCAGCEEGITNLLRRLPGVQDVQARSETQRVVSFDSARLTPDQLRAKLKRLGYRVQPGSDRRSAEPRRPIG